MKYPKYEILFCVQDEIDPVIMVVQSLLAKYPKTDAKLLVGGKTVGVNPKINNIVPGYESAKYGHILISDSGLKMKEDTLLDMVLTMLKSELIGLVHQMPYVCHRGGFASVLEAVHFSTIFAKYYLTINCAGFNCTTGMSCLFLKSVVDEAGGLRLLGQYLAEDFFLAQAFLDRGYLLRVASQPAWQNHGTYSVSAWHARMVRWGKIRTATVPHVIFLEPSMDCLVNGLLGAFAFYYLVQISPLMFMGLHILVWFLLDYTLCRIVNNGPLPFSRMDFVLAWIASELCRMYAYFVVHLTSDVHWRQRKFKVRWGGQLVEVKEKASV